MIWVLVRILGVDGNRPDGGDEGSDDDGSASDIRLSTPSTHPRRRDARFPRRSPSPRARRSTGRPDANHVTAGSSRGFCHRTLRRRRPFSDGGLVHAHSHGKSVDARQLFETPTPSSDGHVTVGPDPTLCDTSTAARCGLVSLPKPAARPIPFRRCRTDVNPRPDAVTRRSRDFCTRGGGARPPLSPLPLSLPPRRRPEYGGTPFLKRRGVIFGVGRQGQGVGCVGGPCARRRRIT